MIERIADGRTDLVFGHLAAGRVCHGEFRIHPLAISPATTESALDLHLLGKPH